MYLLKKKRKVNRQTAPELDGITPWIFLLPSLLMVSVLVLVPFCDVLRRSFFSAMGGQFVGFRNYTDVFQNEAFQRAAGNTAKFTLICIPVLLLFSLLLALLVDALKEKRGIFKTSFLIPMSIPVASVVLLWKVIFHENGLLNHLLGSVGMETVHWLNSESAMTVLMVTYIWKNAGYDMVLWLSGITAISPSLYESASLDGAGALRCLFRITLPNLMPTLFTAAVLSLLNSFKVFREAYLISGSYPHESIYMLQHLFNNWFTRLDIDKMCAGAVLMALVVMALIGFLQMIWGRVKENEKWMIAMLLSAAVLFVWVPLWMLLSASFMGSREMVHNLAPVLSEEAGYAHWPILPQYPTLKPYVELLLDAPEFFTMFWNSCKQVFPIVAGQIVIGAPAAWAFARFRFRGKGYCMRCISY